MDSTAGLPVKASMTLLCAERSDAGKQGEDAPSAPENSFITIPANGCLLVPAWSFAVIGVPTDTDL